MPHPSDRETRKGRDNLSKTEKVGTLGKDIKVGCAACTELQKNNWAGLGPNVNYCEEHRCKNKGCFKRQVPNGHLGIPYLNGYCENCQHLEVGKRAMSYQKMEREANERARQQREIVAKYNEKASSVLNSPGPKTGKARDSTAIGSIFGSHEAGSSSTSRVWSTEKISSMFDEFLPKFPQTTNPTTSNSIPGYGQFDFSSISSPQSKKASASTSKKSGPKTGKGRNPAINNSIAESRQVGMPGSTNARATNTSSQNRLPMSSAGVQKHGRM